MMALAIELFLCFVTEFHFEQDLHVVQASHACLFAHKAWYPWQFQMQLCTCNKPW